MKLLILALACTLSLIAMAAESEKSDTAKVHRAVFEVSVKGADKWLGALRNVENALDTLGKQTKIEVVAHGKGIGLLLAKTASENAGLKGKIEKFYAEGLIFSGCENTMQREKLEKKDLIEQATTVDSGVAEVIRKQTAGWAYLKSGG
ncbi:MAG: DsrE family protein [Terrimicrobiaceae bacterium]